MAQRPSDVNNITSNEDITSINSITNSKEDVNTAKYSMQESENHAKDNKGRTLSKEQQEYFKNSKARDENGRLLEVYYGTPDSNFNVFDRKYIGTSSGDVGFLGDGFYFATHEGEAKYYGKNIKKAYLNIKNPFNIKYLTKYNNINLNGESGATYLEIKNLIDLS